MRFRTRGELFRAIGTVRQAVADGDIEEIDAGPMKGTIAFGDLSDAASADGRSYEKRNPFTGEVIANVPDAGPLDDLLLYRFRCSDCGQNFVLGAETYHGSGGSWGKSAPLGST